MIFASQVILLVLSSERCSEGWKVPIGVHISLLNAHRRVRIRDFSGFSIVLPFKIPVSLQIMGDGYNVEIESVSTLLHLHLEYYKINLLMYV